MADKVRLGFIGANIHSAWAGVSHLPALKVSPDVELTAVCTTRPESAEEARQALGAKLAFHDWREMLASADIDAVAVVVKVPEHYVPTKAAIEAGKHVYTEWPLGKNTAEAEELTALAKAAGVQATVGLQSRANPALMYMKELVESGYVGEVLSCHVTSFRGGGGSSMPSSRTWQGDISQGANTLTIANGHVIDALRFVVGDFARVSCTLTTQTPRWFETDTERWVDVTSPDNVLVAGQLKRGGVAGVHAAAVPWAGPGFRMEIYGREGTLLASNSVSSQRGEPINLRGAQNGNTPAPLEVPDRLKFVPADFPLGDPYNVGQMYALFADAIRTGQNRTPTFETAVETHKLLDALKESSDKQQPVTLA